MRPKETTMNIYDFALKMEKDGEEYYRDLASKTTDKGLQTIFNMLADEEQVHYDAILQMKNEDPNAELAETNVLSSAKNVFTEMKSDATEFNFAEDQIAMYQKAADTEKDNYKYYLEKAEEMTSDSHKEIFLKLAEEEKKHVHLLNNIVEFVSRPKQWVEDAEFSNLEDY